MSEGATPDEIVGHKTFCENGVYRHEPLTSSEADKIMASVEASKVKRANEMPTEKDAVNAMWSAWYRLKELGWQESTYAHEFKKDGMVCRIIEIGSSGIHTGYYHKTGEHDVWWIDAEGYPSHPCLVKATDAAIAAEAREG